jgi:type I restriction enzyme S subunit
MISDRPSGWASATLEELAENPMQDIVDGPFGSNLKADELRRHSFRAGDIVITKLGEPVGKACLVPPTLSNGIIVADIVRARIDDRIAMAPFVAYAINAPDVVAELNLEIKGSTRPRVNLRHVRSLRIPLPPLNEQRHIVAKVEKLLDKVDACQKRLAKIPILLKRFRQSVLAAACSGRLTEDWREKTWKSRSCGDESMSVSVPTENEYPPEWRVTTLGTLAKIVTSGSRGWAKYYAERGAVFIRAQNINSDVLNLDQITYVQLPESCEGLRTKVQLNDILITITGANVTKTALVQNSLQDAYVNQHVALVRLNDSGLSGFVFLSIISPMHGRQQLQSMAYGQGKPGLNLDNIRNVVVAIPPLAEQNEILHRVDELFDRADQITARYENAKSYIDKLKQSILGKAFRGELVRQDPNDEPASVLLERSRAVRANQKPRSSRRKAKVPLSVADSLPSI